MDVNKTVYWVTVGHTGVSKTVPLIWDPIDLSVEPPQPPTLKQHIMSRYYHMTNFSQFLPMINNALKEAWSIVGSAPSGQSPAKASASGASKNKIHFLILIRKYHSLI